MNKLIKFLVYSYWDYQPRFIASNFHVGIGSYTDDEIEEYPIDYEYNKKNDEHKMFFFIGDKVCKMATLGNKPLERAKKCNSRGMSFTTIRSKYPSIKHIYAINPRLHAFNKFYSPISRYDHEKMYCLFVQYGIGTDVHLSKGNLKSHKEHCIKSYNYYLASQLKRRLMDYKASKTDDNTVKMAMAKALRSCADHIEGKNPNFGANIKSPWHRDEPIREFFSDMFNFYKYKLDDDERVRLLESLKNYC